MDSRATAPLSPAFIRLRWCLLLASFGLLMCLSGDSHHSASAHSVFATAATATTAASTTSTIANEVPVHAVPVVAHDLDRQSTAKYLQPLARTHRHQRSTNPLNLRGAESDQVLSSGVLGLVALALAAVAVAVKAPSSLAMASSTSKRDAALQDTEGPDLAGEQLDPENCAVYEGTMVCELPDPEAEAKGVESASLLQTGEPQTAAMAVLSSLFLISPFFMWGTSMVAMKSYMDHTTPLFVAGMRCVPAGLIILAFAASQGKDVMPKTAKAWLWVMAFAIVDATAFQGFLAEGLRRTSAGLGSVIIDSQPLTVAVLASVFFGESLGTKGILGLFLGVVGISLVEISPDVLSNLFSGGALDVGDASLWDRGEWWMLLAAQSMALGTVMVRLFSKEVDPVVATGWHLILGGLPLFALCNYVDGGFGAIQMGTLTGLDWLNLTYTVLAGAVGYGAFFYLAQKGSLTKLSSLTFLTPMFAVLGGYLALGESLSSLQGMGAAVTVAAIYLINSPNSEESA